MNDTPPSDSDEGENFTPVSYREAEVYDAKSFVKQESPPHRSLNSSPKRNR